MKKTNRLFSYAICIILSALIASATLMAGATDDPASEVSKESTLPSISAVTTTSKDIVEIVTDVIYDNGLDDDLSELGDDIRDTSGKAAGFLSTLIEFIEGIRNGILKFFEQLFNLSKWFIS